MKVRSRNEVLRERVEAVPGNAGYLGHQIENEIIAARGRIVQGRIGSRVNSAQCFTLLVDETANITGEFDFYLSS